MLALVSGNPPVNILNTVTIHSTRDSRRLCSRERTRGSGYFRCSLLVLHHQPTFLPFPFHKGPLLAILCYPVVCLSFGRKSAKRSIYSWQLHNLPDNRAAGKVNDQYMQSIEPAKMNHRSRCEQATRSLLAPSLQSTIAIRKQSPYSGVGEGGKGCPYTIAPELIIHSLWWQFSVLSFFFGGGLVVSLKSIALHVW